MVVPDKYLDVVVPDVVVRLAQYLSIHLLQYRSSLVRNLHVILLLSPGNSILAVQESTRQNNVILLNRNPLDIFPWHLASSSPWSLL